MRSAHPRSRLGGILVIALGAATVGAAAVSTRPVHANQSPAPVHDAWLDNLKGTHRQLFDAPNPNGGMPLLHVMNYYDTYNKAYGVKDREVNGILTFYGTTTLYAVNDAMWAKYRIGEFLQTKDAATGQPATANPWRAAPVIMGNTIPSASLESLVKRGATLILCNNAITYFAGEIARTRGLAADTVLADLKANLLPGVTMVPGMVIAIEKAQRRGISYHRQ